MANDRIDSLKEERAAVVRDLIEFESALKAQHVENRRFGEALRALKEQHHIATTSNDTGEMERRLESTRRQLHTAIQELDMAKTRMTELEETQRAEAARSVAFAPCSRRTQLI